jgi:hypothetical protein
VESVKTAYGWELLFGWRVSFPALVDKPTNPLMKTYTLKERNIQELTKRLGRHPTEVELAIKELAEEEAYEQIEATPRREYVMSETVGAHHKLLAEEIGRKPTEKQWELFEEIYTEEIDEANMNREMRM